MPWCGWYRFHGGLGWRRLVEGRTKEEAQRAADATGYRYGAWCFERAGVNPNGTKTKKRRAKQ